MCLNLLQQLYWYAFVRKNNFFYFDPDYQSFLVYIGLLFENTYNNSDNLFLYFKY